MALKGPKYLFGIHSLTPYHQATGLPYGIMRVIGGSTLSVTGELIKLTGGSSKYSWASEDGNSTAELSIKPKEIPNWIFKLMLGKLPSETLDDPGATTALTNKNGTSVVDAADGIASVGVKAGSEDDLKFSKYVVVAVSPTTVDVYGLTNVDFKAGTDKVFEDDLLKITESPLSITKDTAVEIPGFGVELTGGSAVTMTMTADDTAVFDIEPPSLDKIVVDIGGIGDCIPEFGAYITAQRQADGTMWTFDCFRVKALGFPFGMKEKAFNEAEITADVLYDNDEDKLFQAKRLTPATACS